MTTKEKLELLKKYDAALRKIANKGTGIHPSVIDWENIGKWSVAEAKEVLRVKCKACGK